MIPVKGGYMYLVKPEFVKENPKAIIIDCRYDMSNPPEGFNQYQVSHLIGAHYIDLDKDMTADLAEHGGRHPLKDLEIFTEKIGSFGVESESQIIIYDNGELAMASRLWFMLKLIGLEAFIIEGGFQACQNILKTDASIPSTVVSKLEMAYQDKFIRDIEAVKTALRKEDSVLVDSRSNSRYLGLEEPFDKVAGHIPGAINLFWKDNFSQGNMSQNLDQMKEFFDGLDKYNEIIFHCGSGITGCVNMFFLNELGIESKLYAGSYSDWVSYDDNVVVIKGNVIKKVGEI